MSRQGDRLVKLDPRLEVHDHGEYTHTHLSLPTATVFTRPHTRETHAYFRERTRYRAAVAVTVA